MKIKNRKLKTYPTTEKKGKKKKQPRIKSRLLQTMETNTQENSLLLKDQWT